MAKKVNKEVDSEIIEEPQVAEEVKEVSQEEPEVVEETKVEEPQNIKTKRISMDESQLIFNILSSKAEVFSDLNEARRFYDGGAIKKVQGTDKYPSTLIIKYKGEEHYCISLSSSVKYKINGKRR